MSPNTDSIKAEEASMTEPKADATGSPSGGRSDSIRDKIGQTGTELKDQALGKARDYAAQGKDKATDVLDTVAKLVNDTASVFDGKLGGVGDYAHDAAGALNQFSESLRSKDFEELLDDAKAAVKRNPVIAIGAAAAVGFVLVRLIKAAGGTSDAPTDDSKPTAHDIKIDR